MERLILIPVASYADALSGPLAYETNNKGSLLILPIFLHRKKRESPKYFIDTIVLSDSHQFYLFHLRFRKTVHQFWGTDWFKIFDITMWSPWQ